MTEFSSAINIKFYLPRGMFTKQSIQVKNMNCVHSNNKDNDCEAK